MTKLDPIVACCPKTCVCVHTRHNSHTRVQLTKISSANATPSPLVVTAAPGGGATFSAGSRKGLFDMVAGNGNCWLVGSGLRGEGDAALMRLRKGLLELMLLRVKLPVGDNLGSGRGLRVSQSVGLGCDKARDRQARETGVRDVAACCARAGMSALPCATAAIFAALYLQYL